MDDYPTQRVNENHNQQGSVSASVAAIHATYLWNRLVAFIDHTQKIIWKIIQQTEGPRAGFLLSKNLE
jgi:hypothetical protein